MLLTLNLTSGKRSQRLIAGNVNFYFFGQLYPLAPGYNRLKGVRVTKIGKKIMFEVVWDQLESKKDLQRESITKYLRLTLGFY